jgi:type IV pilus assembly protein PilE
MNHLNVGTGNRRGMLGMTLIELMAVVLVIGVLGMIAIPSYRQYVMRAQRTEAKAALLQLQTNQERYYLANREYGSVDELVGADLLNDGGITERGTYVITVDSPDATGYTAFATPREGGEIDMTRDAQCTQFSITAQGERSATGTDPANCW